MAEIAAIAIITGISRERIESKASIPIPGMEKIFSSEGIQIRVLEAEVKRGVIKIVEPNGELTLFSDRVKRKELSRIERKQETLMCQADYFYHRIKRFIKKKLIH